MSSWVLFPRFHFTEIEDTTWCPNWLRDHAHSSLARLWQVKSGNGNSLAKQACDVLIELLGGMEAAAKFTFIDSCAGAGGPTPYFENYINRRLKGDGHEPVRFVLTDWAPYIEAWQALSKQSENIDYIERPIDASKAIRLAEPGKRECRIFNLCFHHFDNPAAAQVLRGAVDSADAFVIFEITHRTMPSIIYTVAASAFGALSTTWIEHFWSPFHLFFTFLIPLFPLFYIFDGFMSCVRGRTPEETFGLLRKQKDLDLSNWELTYGEKMVLPPFGKLFYYAGVKKESNATS